MPVRARFVSLLTAFVMLGGCAGQESAAPAASPAETPVASPAETPVASPAETPVASPAETPAASPAETPAASPAETPAASPAEMPAASPAETPAGGASYFAIETRLGRMVVRLFDDTPRHRDNFRKLVAEGFYDGTTFHRVIGGFMIQGGDPNSKDDDPMNDGNGGPGYTVPAEIVPGRFHRRGMLAAARQGDNVNPERRSSGSQFFIVHGGTPYTDEQLDQMEAQLREQIPDPGFRFSDEARAVYRTEGGAPWLDGMYTIFGELVEGFDVLDAIATVPTPRRQRQYAHPAVADQPLEPVPMTIRPLPDYHP